MSDFELHRLCQQYTALQEHQLDMDLLLDSGKLRLLAQLLTDLKEQVRGVELSRQCLASSITYKAGLECLTGSETTHVFNESKTGVTVDKIIDQENLFGTRTLFLFNQQKLCHWLPGNQTHACLVSPCLHAHFHDSISTSELNETAQFKVSNIVYFDPTVLLHCTLLIIIVKMIILQQKIDCLVSINRPVSLEENSFCLPRS